MTRSIRISFTGNELDRGGGHYAPLEEPVVFVQELRAFVRKLR